MYDNQKSQIIVKRDSADGDRRCAETGDYIFQIIRTYIVILFVILIFSILLLKRKSFKNTEVRFFWLTVLSCLFLVFTDIAETFCSEDPSLLFFRTLFSVLCYFLRSTSALGLLFVIMPYAKKRRLLWIPNIINLLVCSTAFFSDIAFGYDADYAFYRGPLGYVAFIVPFFYLLFIIIIVFTRFSDKKGAEKFIVPLCCIFCLCAALADVFGGGVHLTEAIIINCVFFYVVLYSSDSRRDPLTDLLNRKAFYDDFSSYSKEIAAVISLDVNGLKTLNDTIGHHAGDLALVTVGKCISSFVNSNAQAYRIGGDEFIILFFSGDAAAVAEIEKKIHDAVNNAGYSIAVGHAMADKDKTLDEVIKQSDSRMYADKDEYYRQSGAERRIH